MRLIHLLPLSLLVCAACGGLRPQPGECSSEEGAWGEVCEGLDQARWRDFSVLLGDRDGTRFTYNRGDGPDTVYRIASASKLLTSVTILRLVDRGILSLEDHPQQHIAWWPSDPADPRSAITLRQLLAFTAGYRGEVLDAGCIRERGREHEECARELSQTHFAYTPGTTFHYAAPHMHLAALMATKATGKSWNTLFREEVGDVVGMSQEAGFDDDVNPDPGGGARASGQDYAKLMRALARGELLKPATQAELLRDQSQDAEIAHSPVTDYGWTWRYGLGCWKECYQAEWGAACDAQTVYSSAGAFGFYPWIDAATGRWGVVALQRTLLARPAEDSVRLIRDVAPAIERAWAGR